MIRLPRPTGRRLLAALEKAGFKTVRVRGSHHRLQHRDGRRTTVPVHRGETIGPGLLQRILQDCDLSVEELLEFL